MNKRDKEMRRPYAKPSVTRIRLEDKTVVCSIKCKFSDAVFECTPQAQPGRDINPS